MVKKDFWQGTYNRRKVLSMRCNRSKCANGFRTMVETYGANRNVLQPIGWCPSTETLVVPLLGTHLPHTRKGSTRNAYWRDGTNWHTRLRLAAGIARSIAALHAVGRVNCDWLHDEQWMIDDAREAVFIDFDATPLMPNICAGGTKPDYFWKTAAAHFGGDKTKAKAWFRTQAPDGYMQRIAARADREAFAAALGVPVQGDGSVSLAAVERAYEAKMPPIYFKSAKYLSASGGAGDAWDEAKLGAIRDEARHRDLPAGVVPAHARPPGVGEADEEQRDVRGAVRRVAAAPRAEERARREPLSGGRRRAVANGAVERRAGLARSRAPGAGGSASGSGRAGLVWRDDGAGAGRRGGDRAAAGGVDGLIN